MAKKAEGQAEFEEIEKFDAKNQKKLKRKSEESAALKTENTYKQAKSGWGTKFVLFFVITCLICANGYLLCKYTELQNIIKQNRNVYIYNMENTLLLAGMADENQQFEKELTQLEKEIDASTKKLSTIKDEKLKQEYQDMYMKSLKIKRDDLIKKHEEFVQTLSKNVNKSLVKVAEKNHVATIFAARAIAVTTPYVVDVTPQIAEILKKKMNKD